jgi:hypothetical protein
MITKIETRESQWLSILDCGHASTWSLSGEPSSTCIVPRLRFPFHVGFYWVFLLPSLIIFVGLDSSLKVVVDLL